MPAPATFETAIPATAALLSDPSRVAMLLALADGRALPAGDLAHAASISRPTASQHLIKLESAGFLRVLRQGRHRYYRLAGEHVGALMESLAAAAPNARLTANTGPRDAELRNARLCFGHLAGRYGVALADRLIEVGVLEWGDAGYLVSSAGWSWLADLGVDIDPIRSRKPAVSTCHVDWSERRPHVAGPFAVALARWLLDDACIVRVRGSRAVRTTARGARWLSKLS